MEIIGSLPFERFPNGKLRSRIGTIFLKTPGLVTQSGVHAMQRMAWIAHLNDKRASEGLPPLTPEEEADEIKQSVDLLFNDQYVLIRPVPTDMATAIRGDIALQSIVSKRKIRYLNIQNEQVRNTLRKRGEAWRMSPVPRDADEIINQIQSSRTAISGLPIYYYNQLKGTRYITAQNFADLSDLPFDQLLFHLKEIQHNLQARNRFANPEVAIFPPEIPVGKEVQQFFKIDFDTLSEKDTRRLHAAFAAGFLKLIPRALRDESLENGDWVKEMARCVVHDNDDTGLSAIIESLSPEFFMQIEWLPGGEINRGELIFDPIYDELESYTGDKADPNYVALAKLCDPRARGILLNYLREYGKIEYVNIGRTRRSLSLRKHQGPRAFVYIVELKEENAPEPIVKIIRIQRWTSLSLLQDGKALLNAMIEADDYTDYVMDRRLGARQLGMRLPPRMTSHSFREPYAFEGGDTFYVRTSYFERDYIKGRASAKIPASTFNNPSFAVRFFLLLGQAAAANIVVGRATLEEPPRTIFDDGDEIVILDKFSMPSDLILSEPTGAFANYTRPYTEDAPAYAQALLKRQTYVSNYEECVEVFLRGFEKRLSQILQEYRSSKIAFDTLFRDRPNNPGGSMAYRWECILSRLNHADINQITQAIRQAALAERS